LYIEPHVHEAFVRDFGLNMLNTLTSKEHRLTAHKRRIHVFDERGGIIGGQNNTLQEYQNLTTGVFHSKTRKVVGVRYRCIPNNLSQPEIGAFHTHPALYDESAERVRRRIDQLLWLSEMDRQAFYRQYEMYGYEWHFIGCIDIGCFNIHDLNRGEFAPRYILRYPKLEQLIENLAPSIAHYDLVLRNQGDPPRSGAGMLTELVHHLTQQKGELVDILFQHDEERGGSLAKQVAMECQLRGLTMRQVAHLLKKTLPPDTEPAYGAETSGIAAFKRQLIHSYDRLAQLV
jgi:hypothetical protein